MPPWSHCAGLSANRPKASHVKMFFARIRWRDWIRGAIGNADSPDTSGSFCEAEAQGRWLDELVELDFTRMSPLPDVNCTDSRKAGYGDDE
jgi:hypothetical protein